MTVIVLIGGGADSSDLAGGVILALVASVGAALALEPRWSSLAAAAATAGTVVLLATTQDAGGALDSWLGGAVALFCSLAFLVLLAWVGAVGTRSALVERGRGTWWVRMLTVLLAFAVLWPDTGPRVSSSPITMHAFVADFAAASPALIWLGLILATVGLLWRVASNPLPGPILRSLAILVALALMLRSNVVVGIPWSFVVGAVLVWRVLYVSGHETSTRTLWPSAGEGSVEMISTLVRTSASSQFARNMRASARRRATSSGVSFEEAAAFRQAYEEPARPMPVPPNEQERAESMGWGAVADPRDRALRSMGAALLIGIPLSIPYLAEVGTQLSVADLTSVTTWGEIVTAFIFVLRFPLYGLVFGYFFPLVRGTTGLGKSLHLLIVLVVSEGIALLVPFGSTSAFIQAFSLRALGLAALCLVLGIGADAWALRRAGAGVADLADLYQVRRATLSISTVTVALLTTAATTMATVTVTSATERLFEQVESPPAATAGQGSGETREDTGP